MKVAIEVSGTGGGFAKFRRGETDVQNASRPINASERAACEASWVSYVEVPVAYDALTVIVHPKNDWASAMTIAELEKLVLCSAYHPDELIRPISRVSRWRQARPSGDAA